MRHALTLLGGCIHPFRQDPSQHTVQSGPFRPLCHSRRWHTPFPDQTLASFHHHHHSCSRSCICYYFPHPSCCTISKVDIHSGPLFFRHVPCPFYEGGARFYTATTAFHRPWRRQPCSPLPLSPVLAPSDRPLWMWPILNCCLCSSSPHATYLYATNHLVIQLFYCCHSVRVCQFDWTSPVRIESHNVASHEIVTRDGITHSGHSSRAH